MKDKTKLLFWEKYCPLLITVIVGFIGWYFVDWLAANRDRANKQRDMQFEYLISSYRKLANAAWREPKPGSEYFRDMETAMADIQLFGTDSQIKDAKNFMDEFQNTRKGPLDELLRNLRNDLRQEMDLSKIKGNVQFFRPEGIPKLPISAEKR